MLITVIVVSSCLSDRPASEFFCRFEKVLWLCLAEWGAEQWRSAFLRCGESDAEKMFSVSMNFSWNSWKCVSLLFTYTI